MAELDSVDLKLNLTAEDKAGDIIKAVTGLVDSLNASLKALADNDSMAVVQDSAEKTAEAVDSVNQAVTRLDTAMTELGDKQFADPFAAWVESINSAATGMDRVSQEATTVSGVSDAGFLSWDTTLGQVFTKVGQVSAGITSLQGETSDKGFQGYVTALSSAADQASTLGKNINDLQSNTSDKGFTDWDTTLTDAVTQSTSLGDNVNTVQGEITDTGFQSWVTSITDAVTSTDSLNTNVGGVIQTASVDVFGGWLPSLQAVSGELTTIITKLEEVASLSGKGTGKVVIPSDVSVSIPTGQVTSVSHAGCKKSSTPSQTQLNEWFAGLGSKQGQANMTPDERAAYARAAMNNDVSSFYAEYGAKLGAPTGVSTVKSTSGGSSTKASGGKTSGTGKSSGKSSGNVLTDMSKGLGDVGSHAINGAMNAMMIGYIADSLVQGAGTYQYIQEMMKQGMGLTKGNYSAGTVNQAAQAYTMLASAGLTGNAGVSMLTGLQSNLATMFTRTGSGGLSKDALILESYGLGPQTGVQSPWSTLQTIQKEYEKLMGQGRADDAGQLLSLTGTTQLGTLFDNWSTAQKDASSINLGMNSSQLGAAVGKDQNMMMDMQRLSLAFDQFALAILPAIDKITKALTDLANGLSGKTSFGQTISNITKDLGPMGTAIAATIASLKALDIALNFAAGMDMVPGLKGKGTASAAGALTKAIVDMLKANSGKIGSAASSDLIAPFLAAMTAAGIVSIPGMLDSSQDHQQYLSNEAHQVNLDAFNNWENKLVASGKMPTAEQDKQWQSEIDSPDAPWNIGRNAPKYQSAFQKFISGLQAQGVNASSISGAGIQHTSNSLTVQVTGVSGRDKEIAQQVADALVAKLKLKGNFDWSF